MTTSNNNALNGHAIQKRQSGHNLAPPYLTTEGLILVDRRESRKVLTAFGQYAYRTWVEQDPFQACPWVAWYEVRTADGRTPLSRAQKISQRFSSAAEAVVAATQKVKWEIFAGSSAHHASAK
ncbi:MAG TPA: hypothetical protein VNW52_11170 [Burkholderiaceae bacterium]|jgi:hypothetical protein|nr:hypothetical protein [Burkholderiaceae bacterium]